MKTKLTTKRSEAMEVLKSKNMERLIMIFVIIGTISFSVAIILNLTWKSPDNFKEKNTFGPNEMNSYNLKNGVLKSVSGTNGVFLGKDDPTKELIITKHSI